MKEDLLAVITFRNSLLDHLKGNATYQEMAQASGVSISMILGFLTLTTNPRDRRNGEFKDSAKKLAAHYGYNPEEMFPASLYLLKFPSKIRRKFSSIEIIPLLAARSVPLLPDMDQEIDRERLKEEISSAIATLKPIEQAVVAMRFGMFEDRPEMTLGEIAEELGKSKARVAQIEQRALRNLRHPVRTRPLVGFLEYK